jgi:hypothetical protein
MTLAGSEADKNPQKVQKRVRIVAAFNIFVV